jgi:Flp pilus assembly protein TadG
VHVIRGLHRTADRAREERGAVLVLAAVMIPVFILLTALVVDAGTWFTHKRQLQNRADAGALAAGVEYAARWGACAQTTDLLSKADATQRIEDAARRYAGDPAASGTLYNTEVTDQTRVNVEINSTSSNFDENTSWNDPGVNGTGPCDPQPGGDDFSTAGNIYTDVKVKEVNQRSLFGAFGLTLFRNRAQARVELKTATAGDKFIPIAVPEQLVRQAQLRYIDYCDPANPQLVKKVDLAPLGNDYQPTDTTLWGPVTASQPGAPAGVLIDWPSCQGRDTNVGVEVRIAGVDPSVVDVDALGCQQLAASRFADCWSRLSNVRVYRDDPRTETWIQDVALTGGSTDPLCSQDAYFAKPRNAASCDFGIRATIDFDKDILGGGTVAGDFTVRVGGVTLNPPGSGQNGMNGTWTGGNGTNSVLGRSDVTLSWSWTDRNPSHTRGASGPRCRNGNNNPCTASGSVVVGSLFLSDGQNAGIVDLVRTADNSIVDRTAIPGEIHSKLQGTTADTVYPLLGLNSALHVGQRRVLRVSGPQSNQSVDCEPGVGGQGHDFQMFRDGCDPWYGINAFTGAPWWYQSTLSCPDRNGILAQPNGSSGPWRCVVKAPGFSPNVLADGIAAAIGNCSDLQSNSCRRYACTNPNYYDPDNPGEWALGAPGQSPRVVKLFIVPYGAYKNTGPQEGLPILNFAAFYVTGWKGQGGAGRNPCENAAGLPNGALPDEDTQGGDIVGYFVDWTEPGGPADPNSTCVLGQLTPCRAVLVR